MSESLVVDELRVDKVVDLSGVSVFHHEEPVFACTHVPGVLEGSGATEDVVLDTLEEGLSILSLLLESIGSIEVLDVFLKGRTVGPALERTVVTRLNSLN